MVKVLTVGVFDFFHFGHLRLFENAKRLGDYLIVAVQENDYILKTKPGAKVLYSTEQRIKMVSALRVVDEVITYQRVEDLLPQVDFDIFAKGPDQIHDGFIKAISWCEKKGKDVIVLPRTSGISSSHIKSVLYDLAVPSGSDNG